MKKEINDHSIGKGLTVTKKSMTTPFERALMLKKK